MKTTDLSVDMADISNSEWDAYDCDNNKKSLCCKIATWRGKNNIPIEHIRKIKITQNNELKRKKLF